MAGKLHYIKALAPEICGYWPGSGIRSQLYAITGIDASALRATPNIKASQLLRPTRLEGAAKGYLAASFGVVAPVCQSCGACLPLRVNTEKFTLSSSQEKTLAKKEFAIDLHPNALLNPHELFRLFKNYTAARHGEKESGMHAWNAGQFRDWLDFMPYILTIRDQDAHLRGFAALEADSKSAILEYIAYDPALLKKSLGKLIWLEAMNEAKKAGIQFVYVGAYAKDSPKLGYKAQHSGLETFVFDEKTNKGEWVDFDPAIHTRGPRYSAMLTSEGFTL